MNYSATLLFVDDDPGDQYLYRDILMRIDPELSIQIVNDGVEAIEYLHQAAAEQALPQLVISDVNMPRMDGVTLLRTLKGHPEFRVLPICICSTTNSTTVRSVCEGLGAAHYYVKPFTLDEIETMLDEIVRTWLLESPDAS